MRSSKLLTLLCLGLLTASSLSCRNQNGSAGLTVTLRPLSTFALPTKATSCYTALSGGDPDLSSPSVVYNSLSLKWTDTSKSFTLAYLDLSFNSPALDGQRFDYYLADQELGAIFASDGTTMLAMTDPANPPTMASDCGLKAGSIPIINQNNTAFVTGVLKVVGYSTDDGGNVEPIQVQIPINFQWQGLQ
jgi:hypothetical protein